MSEKRVTRAKRPMTDITNQTLAGNIEAKRDESLVSKPKKQLRSATTTVFQEQDSVDHIDAVAESTILVLPESKTTSSLPVVRVVSDDSVTDSKSAVVAPTSAVASVTAVDEPISTSNGRLGSSISTTKSSAATTTTATTTTTTATTSSQRPSPTTRKRSAETAFTSSDISPTVAVVPRKPEITRKCVFRRQKCSDPALCLDVLQDLYKNYYDREGTYAAKPYMTIQEDINIKMRSILVDWLVEVHYKFKLQAPTLWLCVNIIDRYLSAVAIPRGRLQLVGVCSLLIACKFEEILTPNIKDCLFITDHAYQKEDLVNMESLILQQIDYQVYVPTGYHFLIRYLNSIAASERTKNLAFYYAERLLQEAEVLDYEPHLVVAGALYAALKQQQQHLPSTQAFADKAASMPCWNSILQTESGLTEAQVIPVARIIVTKVAEVSETASKRLLIAAKKKYLQNSLGVSKLPLPVI